MVGKGTAGDVAEAVQGRVEAELQLKDETTGSPQSEIQTLTKRLDDVERKLDTILKKLPGR